MELPANEHELSGRFVLFGMIARYSEAISSRIPRYVLNECNVEINDDCGYNKPQDKE